jgi:hypothetical protein
MGIVAKQSVRLTWPQSQAVPGAGYYQLYRDGSATPENDSPIPAWPDGHGKRGWGRGGRGRGGWGKGAGGFGWGLGGRGRGGWGTGGQRLTMDTEPIADGVHVWRVLAYDGAGNESAGNPTASLAVAGEPEPPAEAEAAGYAGGVLSVTFTLSEDDEGV